MVCENGGKLLVTRLTQNCNINVTYLHKTCLKLHFWSMMCPVKEKHIHFTVTPQLSTCRCRTSFSD